MSKRVTPSKAEQAQEQAAERDLLRTLALSASTAEQHLAVLDRIGTLEQGEQTAAERNALETARLRGGAMYGTYAAIVAQQGGKPTAPRETEFATIRSTLGIEAKPDTRKGETFTPWHGIRAYSTAEQAWNLHQWASEDGLVTQAHAAFVAAHPKQAAAWLGARAGGLIGLATFARRTQQADKDGATMLPSSGTPTQRRDLLVARAVEKGDAVLDAKQTTVTETGEKQTALREKLESPSAARFVETVAGLSSMTVSMWSDKQIADMIDALRLAKGWDRPAAEQGEQVAAVTVLAEQAEQGEQAEQIAPPAIDIAAIAAKAAADAVAAALAAM